MQVTEGVFAGSQVRCWRGSTCRALSSNQGPWLPSLPRAAFYHLSDLSWPHLGALSFPRETGPAEGPQTTARFYGLSKKHVCYD